MGYWSNESDGCDYAFDAVAVIASIIVDRMFSDAEGVVDEAFPEQAIAASVKCLRLLGKEFPTAVRLSFQKRDLARAEEAFKAWHEKVQSDLPKNRREAIKECAEKEFALYRLEVLR